MGVYALINEHKMSEYPKPMSFLAIVFWTGLFGGSFGESVGYIAYLFNFTEIRPNVILEPWALGYWKNGWLGTVISFILMGVFSVGAAFIYYGALKKLKGIWFGLGYGLVLVPFGIRRIEPPFSWNETLF